jgi:hypothetical protein
MVLQVVLVVVQRPMVLVVEQEILLQQVLLKETLEEVLLDHLEQQVGVVEQVQ